MMNRKLIILFTLTTLLVLPAVVWAINFPPLSPGYPLNIFGVVNSVVNSVINLIWPFFAAFAVVMFIYAGILFLAAKGDPGKVAEARKALIWGAVGVAVGLLAFSIPWIIFILLGG